MAWQRWQKCNYVRTIALREIRPDGQIWAWAKDDADLADWQSCDRRAQEAQGRVVAFSLLPSAVAPAPAPPTATASLPPVWRRGDEWAFRWTSPAGAGTFVWTLDREEAIDGTPHYVIKTGSREIFYRKSDIATSLEKVDGIPVVVNTPARLRYVWPLSVGSTWEQTIVEERPGAHHTAERVYVAMVEAEETAVVPAGVFRTLKIVYRDKATGDIRYEEWYAPAARHPVMLRERLESGPQVRELIAFKLR